ncbi:MAG: hypothetical protein SAK29_20600 [Scytonema sp. PMC 1069.18]|nr:hypothetical protein [Scytonema sp. PMC 1069.18]MEC4883541.1 hypothetical protein [Scytonema sp. PMC 1070.18]
MAQDKGLANRELTSMHFQQNPVESYSKGSINGHLERSNLLLALGWSIPSRC